MSTRTPIAIQTLGSATSSVTFSSIPQGYTDLVLVCSLKSSGTAYISLRCNNDASTNYSRVGMSGTGTSRFSELRSNRNQFEPEMGGSGIDNNNNYIGILQIMNYSNSTTNKTILARTNNAATGVDAVVGTYRSTLPITSITILTSNAETWSTGSVFTIYGIAVGNSSAKADGGSSVTTDGTYWYHTFKSSGAFTPRQAITVDYLVVAGGGGGGTGYGGGGGGGGFRTSVGSSTLSLSSNTSYPVVVGAGGAGGPAISTGALSVDGTNGGYSNFASITSTGGGGGGKTVTVGKAGGSGGGGGGDIGTVTGGSGNAGGYSPVEGYNGGSGSNANNGAGGGGGGASAAGSAGSGSTGGAGGAGASSSLSGSSVTYAGGGGGGTYSATAGAGGSGGGGAGSGNVSVSGGNGTAFLGGGGGGGGASVNYSASGNGGSGIVIVRYAV